MLPGCLNRGLGGNLDLALIASNSKCPVPCKASARQNASMSIIPSSIIQLYAETIGLTNIPEEVASALAHEVEYRARLVIQEASKYMTHSRRVKLTVDDINHALEALNVERLYGYSSNESITFRMVPNTNIFYIPREEVDLETFIQQPLPKAPQPMALTSHWLAIDGIQPAIPENPNPQESSAPPASDIIGSALGVPKQRDLSEEAEIRALTKHILSKELQAYYDAVVADLQSVDGERIKAALFSLSTDSGLQQLIPYFVQYVAESVPKNLRNLQALQISIGVIGSLLTNEYVFIEPYLHQVMPPLLSCLMGKRVCADPTREDHWGFRDRCASLLGDICKKYSHVYTTLLPRVSKTMVKTFTDTGKPLSSHYGAIVGIATLGLRAIESLIVPNLEAYLSALDADVASAESTMADDDSVPDNKPSASDIAKIKSALGKSCNKWLQDGADDFDDSTRKNRSNTQNILKKHGISE